MNLGPINIPRMTALQKVLQTDKNISLTDLTTITDAQWNRQVMLNYNASAMFMHYLWEQGAIQSFLKEYKSSRSARDALTKSLKKDFSAIDTGYQQFVREKLLDPEALQKMEKQMEGTRKF